MKSIIIIFLSILSVCFLIFYINKKDYELNEKTVSHNISNSSEMRLRSLVGKYFHDEYQEEKLEYINKSNLSLRDQSVVGILYQPHRDYLDIYLHTPHETKFKYSLPYKTIYPSSPNRIVNNSKDMQSVRDNIFHFRTITDGTYADEPVISSEINLINIISGNNRKLLTFDTKESLISWKAYYDHIAMIILVDETPNIQKAYFEIIDVKSGLSSFIQEIGTFDKADKLFDEKIMKLYSDIFHPKEHLFTFYSLYHPEFNREGIMRYSYDANDNTLNRELFVDMPKSNDALPVLTNFCEFQDSFVNVYESKQGIDLMYRFDLTNNVNAMLWDNDKSIENPLCLSNFMLFNKGHDYDDVGNIIFSSDLQFGEIQTEGKKFLRNAIITGNEDYLATVKRIPIIKDSHSYFDRYVLYNMRDNSTDEIEEWDGLDLLDITKLDDSDIEKLPENSSVPLRQEYNLDIRPLQTDWKRYQTESYLIDYPQKINNTDYGNNGLVLSSQYYQPADERDYGWNEVKNGYKIMIHQQQVPREYNWLQWVNRPMDGFGEEEYTGRTSNGPHEIYRMIRFSDSGLNENYEHTQMLDQIFIPDKYGDSYMEIALLTRKDQYESYKLLFEEIAQTLRWK